MLCDLLTIGDIRTLVPEMCLKIEGGLGFLLLFGWLLWVLLF